MKQNKVSLSSKQYAVPFILITSLFFMWGFARAILDVLNKHFQNELDITITQSSLIQVTTYLGYFLMAIPAGLFINRQGYRRGVVLGLILFGLGSLAFIPCSFAGTFYAYLIALFVIGCGLVFLETSANPYVTELGPKETSTARLNFSQSFNGVGSMFATLVVGSFLFQNSGSGDVGNGSGGNAVVPYAIMGGFAGFLFARLWNVNQVGVYVPEQNFTLMGMAGLITGVMHAPLTGIFLIAELTGGYQLFMPLMIVCISSLLTISIFESHSIYALRLAREGKLLTHHIDKAALTLLGMQDVIEKDYHPVGPDLPMSKLVSEISRSNNNFLPVLDQAGVLLGVIDITKIRHIIFRTELYQHFTVRQLMMQPSAVLTEHDSMDEVMQKFDKTDAAQLPVVDVAGVLKGYISRTRIYSMYRQIVADMSAE